MNHELVLAELARTLKNFETLLDASLTQATTYRNAVLDLFAPMPPCPPAANLPPSFQAIALAAESALTLALDDLGRRRKAHLEQEKLIDHLADYFLVAIVGEVKAGKSTFANAIAEVFEQALGRPVKRIKLEEPTAEKTWMEAVRSGDLIYPAWVRERLGGPDADYLWECLKSDGFRLTEHLAGQLAVSTGQPLVRVHQTEGGYREVALDQFQAGTLEATLEIQGFLSGRICLLDAPGLGSGNPFARKGAEQIWGSTDLLVFMGSKDTPIAESYLQLFKTLKVPQASLLFCIAKCDSSRDDEVNGRIVTLTEFDEGVLAEQRVYVEGILRQAGIDRGLADHRVFGVSSNQFRAARRDGLAEQIRQGRFEPFLEAIVATLAGQGVRIKQEAPLRRARRIAEQVVDALAEQQAEIGKLRDQQADQVVRSARELVAAFRTKAERSLKQLFDLELARVRRDLSRERPSVRYFVDGKRMLEELRAVLDAVGQEFRPYFLRAVNGLEPGGLALEAREHWEQQTEIRRQKVNYQSRTRVGSALGGLAGAAIAAVIGNLAGIPLLASIGAGLGGMLDREVMKTEEIAEPFTRHIRKGDNLEAVARQMAEHRATILQGCAEALERSCLQLENHLLAVLDSQFNLLGARIGEARELIRQIDLNL